MTVSRVLNNKGPVKEETRQQVLAALEKYDYKQKARKTIRRVAFDIDNIGADDYFGRLCTVLINELPHKDYSCVVTSFSSDRKKFIEIVKDSEIIVFCSMTSEKTVEFTRKINPAIKIITMFSSGLGDISVDPDDYMGGSLAANYLYENGHRHVAVCTDWNQVNHINRYKSFLGEFLTLDKANNVDLISFDSSVSLECSCTDAMEKFYKIKTVGTTAIFCTNCNITVTAYNYLRENGYKCPDKISILGYDESSLFNALPLKISRVVFDPVQLVKLVAAYITGIPDIKNDVKKIRTLLSVELKKYASVKAVLS
jgi:DNA-binding LacI/PurR family transcriptional regulator